MANTNIPLQVDQVDAVNPLMLLAQRERQAKQDGFAADERADRKQVSDLQIQQLQKQLKQVDPQVLKSGLQSMAVDTFAVQEMLKSGDTETAGLLAQSIKQTAASLGLPSKDIDNFTNLLGNNPQAASSYWERISNNARQHMPAIFETVTNDQGENVGQRNSQTGQLSELPSTMRPQETNGLDAYLQQLEIEGQQLTNEGRAQTNQINAAKASTEQDENAQRAQSVGTEAQRAYTLTQKLMSNDDGLEGATGPISGRLPSFRESTTSFEADLKELENLLTLGNLGRMSGVLSESDIRILANAASGISTTASEGRMREKLGQIQARLADNPAVMEMLQQGGPIDNNTTANPNRIGRFNIEVLN